MSFPALSTASAPELRPQRLLLITFGVAACSIIYELLLASLITRMAGDAIIWESVTIGVFIASLGLGVLSVPADKTIASLARVEFWLALLGASAPLVVTLLQLVYRIYIFANPALAKLPFPTVMIFGGAAQIVVALIGFVSGWELPLLLRAYPQQNPQGQATVLAAYHLGALAGTLLYCLGIMNLLGPSTASMLVGMVNLGLAFCLVPTLRPATQAGASLLLSALGVCIVLIAAGTPGIEQLMLKNRYFNPGYYLGDKDHLIYHPPKGLATVSDEMGAYSDVERWLSPYHAIDLVTYNNDIKLFLDGRFQLSKSTVTSYHGELTRTPLAYLQRQPRRVLILGGGDGLAAAEILSYPSLESLTLVDIDEVMLNLATRDQRLSALNRQALKHPKLTIRVDDAFALLRTKSLGEFDAIFMDFTFPFTFDSARIYSREFFSLIRQHLTPDGFVALASHLPYDAAEATKLASAGSGTGDLAEYDAMMVSTIRGAGLQSPYLLKAPLANYLIATMTLVDLKQDNVRLLQGSGAPELANSLFRPRFWGIKDSFF